MKARILVVDDEQMVADTLGMIFRISGFECHVCYTGAEALAHIEDFCPDLLLCDISMPGMSGIEVVSSVTAKYPRCRVLLLTGYYTNLAHARSWVHQHSAPSRIMTKPVPPALLLQEADALLHDRRAEP